MLPDGVVIKDVPRKTGMNELQEWCAAKFPDARWPAVQDAAIQGSVEAQYELGEIYSASKYLANAAEWFAQDNSRRMADLRLSSRSTETQQEAMRDDSRVRQMRRLLIALALLLPVVGPS